MKARLLDLLACPACKGNLALRADQVDGEDTVTGTLTCPACRATYAIVGGIPRFVARDSYAASFGDEWHRFRTVQLDSANGTRESEVGFALKTGLKPEDVQGRLVFDAGVGAGRYAEVMARWGAEVVGIDLTRAIDAAAENLRMQPTVHLVQADIFALPFRDHTFDLAYSIGVLHHTPDAKGAFERIQPLVRPGGFFSIFIHGQGNRALYATNRLLRRWTAKASYATTWRFCLLLTGIGKVLEKIPFVGPVVYLVGRQVLFFSPDQHNNFDHFSAGFTSFHRKEEIRGWYAGWDDVAVRYAGVASESIYARGARPVATAGAGAQRL